MFNYRLLYYVFTKIAYHYITVLTLLPTSQITSVSTSIPLIGMHRKSCLANDIGKDSIFMGTLSWCHNCHPVRHRFSMTRQNIDHAVVRKMVCALNWMTTLCWRFHMLREISMLLAFRRWSIWYQTWLVIVTKGKSRFVIYKFLVLAVSCWRHWIHGLMISFILII